MLPYVCLIPEDLFLRRLKKPGALLGSCRDAEPIRKQEKPIPIFIFFQKRAIDLQTTATHRLSVAILQAEVICVLRRGGSGEDLRALSVELIGPVRKEMPQRST